MTPSEVLADLRQRGADLRLSPDGASIQFRGDEADTQLIRTEKTWLLMFLQHEAGGDAPDPRLAFVANAEKGLTHGAIRTRLEVAFDMSPVAADLYIELAIEQRYLRRLTDGRYQAFGKTASRLNVDGDAT